MEPQSRLYVGNLPYVAQPADIEALFASNDIPLKKVDMSIDPFNGRNPSYCFVDLDSATDAGTAMGVLQGQMIRGRPVRINLSTEKKSRGERLPTRVYDHGWRGRDVATKDVRDDAFAFDRWARQNAESHWSAPQEEQRRVYVGGLPRIPNQDVVNEEMRQLFQGWDVQAVSKIISPSEMTRSRPGSHYYCFVDLPTSQDASAAIQALDGKSTPYGGTYEVRIARHRKPTKVQREQLGVKNAVTQEERPRRDLSGNWRRMD